MIRPAFRSAPIASAPVIRVLLGLAALVPLFLTPPVHAQSAGRGAPPPPDSQLKPKVPSSPEVPATYEGLFAERDARAQSVLGYTKCMQQTVRATRSGQLGSVSPAWSIACIQQGKEWRGVLLELTESGSGAIVHRQYALRGAGMMVRERVDTAAASTIARAMRRGLAAPLPGRGVADFMPIALAHKNFTEVWFLPVPDPSAKIVIGGDSLIQMTEDGNRELGHARRTPTIRVVPKPASGATSLLVPSLEERVPLVSEIVAARLAIANIPEVRIRTAQYDAVLSRATGRWKHTPR